MKQVLKGRWVVPVATLVLTLSIGSAAFAATGSSSTDTSGTDKSTAVTSTVTSDTSTPEMATSTDSTANDTSAATAPDASKPCGGQRTDETLLTGDTLAKVQASAVAKVGSDATIVRAETDADGNAKYEAHVQQADGTQVTVYVDESFNVVSVENQSASGHRGGRKGGGQRSDETLLTGDTLAKVQASAVAKVGSDATIVRAETDADGNAKYEAHVQQADGTQVTVYVDESFNVVSVENQRAGDHAGGASSSSTATDSTSTSSN